jgi:hypothetical protein
MKINKLIFEVIDHGDQRYNSLGDYFFDSDGVLRIYVSKMPNYKMQLLILVHELIEVLLTEEHNIPESLITKFDVGYEEARQLGDLSEPGDCSMAPYKNEHCFATGIERLMCSMLNVDWLEYEAACNSM